MKGWVRRGCGGSGNWRTPRLGLVGLLTLIAATMGACGPGVFSGNSSSSSSGGGGGSGTVRSVYVSNFANGKISAMNDVSGTLSAPGTISGGTASGPLGLVVIPAIALYAANKADGKIHEFALDTNGNLSALATITADASPQQLALVPGNAFAYAVNAGGSLSQYTVDATTGVLTKNTPATVTTGLVSPVSAVATTSFLYVTDPQHGVGVILTYAISSSGTLALVGTTPTGPNPNQIIIDPSDTWVLVSDATNGNLLVYQINGNSLTLVSSAAGSPATGLVYLTGTSGAFIYVANPSANTVSTYAFNTGTGAVTLIAVTTGLSSPNGLAVNSLSDLFVTNQGNGTVSSFAVDTTSGAVASIGSFNTQNPADSGSSPNSIVTTD